MRWVLSRTLKLAVIMSTNNPDPTNRIPSAAPATQNADAAVAPFSVAELVALANSFFRALPGQALPNPDLPGAFGQSLPAGPGSSVPAPGFAGSVPGSLPTEPSFAAVAPPPPVVGAAPSWKQAASFVPGASEVGFAVPDVPSLPAADKLPSEADLIRLAGEAGSPVSSGVIPPAASTVPGIPGAQALSASGFNAPGSAPSAVPSAGTISSPVLAPEESPTQSEVPASSAVPYTPALPGYGFSGAPADWSGIGLSGAGASPFALPLPEIPPGFDPGIFQPQGLNFDAGLPALFGALSSPEKYASEEDAYTLAHTVAPFYFLEDSGTLLKPGGSVPVRGSSYDPDLVDDLKLTRGLFDLSSARRDFPALNERVHGKPLIWLDNAATTQKPQSVIDRISWFYEHENSNIHRAAHEMAARATDAYEDARQKSARFLNAPSAKEIIFVRGATEGINLIAKSWGKRHIQKGDEIIVSTIEHHANIVPWQQLAQENGAVLRVIPVDDDGQILLDEYEKLLGPRTKLVSVAQVSNALGTILPTEAIVAAAHRYGARVLIDGAQSVSHMRADVQALDCDFFVFSGHKVFAPTGIGVVYGKPDALAEAPPWQGGGNMIVDVTFEKTVYQVPPFRFEAGTGSIADAVGLGAAIDYVQAIGLENIARHEHELLQYALEGLKTIPGLCLIGTAKEKAAVISFVLDGFKTEEVGAALNREGIAVRSGHHCAQPSLRRFGVETTVRPSLALYNNCDDIDALLAALRRLKSVGA
jgi:cysteine desulfurase/selenocysteine lyase